MSIRLVALGFAASEADHKVREEGGNNRGPRIRQYLDGAGIAVDAPWCAAFVNYCADGAARVLGVPNPLDEVQLEALVQSYHDRFQGSQVSVAEAQAGDLVLFRFSGSDRWNHIGLVAQPPKPGSTTFWSVEGNTSAGVGATDEEREREGDGVYVKPREIGSGYPVSFIAWDGREIE